MIGNNATYVQCVPKTEFDLTALTNSYQPIDAAGFPDSLKMLKIYNPSNSISIDVSFDGVVAHDFIPPLSTFIADFQANHADSPTYTSGTLNVSKGQKIWVKTASNPTFLQVIGYR
jgi:hypothetical protein